MPSTIGIVFTADVSNRVPETGMRVHGLEGLTVKGPALVLRGPGCKGEALKAAAYSDYRQK